MKKVLLALGVIAAVSTAGANAQDLGLHGQPLQVPQSNNVLLTPPPPPPQPAIDGWVRVAPIPGNPQIFGGVTSGDTSVSFGASPNGGNVSVTTPIPGF